MEWFWIGKRRVEQRHYAGSELSAAPQQVVIGQGSVGDFATVIFPSVILINVVVNPCLKQRKHCLDARVGFL